MQCLTVAAAVMLGSCASTDARRIIATGSPWVLSDCADCAELVVIPAGHFTMGSDTDSDNTRPEGPAHEVRISHAFALGRTEVTLGQFRRFTELTGHVVTSGCRVQERQIGARGRVEWRDDPLRSWRDPALAKPQTDDEPVVCVGRVDALAYAAWLSQRTGKHYRLPSEAEWEYAARADAVGSYSWGGNPDNGCSYGNLYDRSGHAASDFGWSYADCDDGFAELAPVGHFKPNGFGLYDMIGNVWEWTADCYRELYDAQVPSDGSPLAGDAGCKNWSVRGGSWMTRPGRQRLTFRGRDPNDAHYSYFGFRVARDVERTDVRH